MSLVSRNPATEEVLQTFAPLTSEQIRSCIDRADQAWQSYRLTPIPQRCSWLRQTAHLLRQDQEKYADLISLEMGKTLTSARAEVEKSAWVCEYYAEMGSHLLQPLPVTDHSTIHYQPLGVLLAVMPWNFPFWQVFRFAAPALVAGNTALLKHAANVPQCALAIAELLHQGGFPEDVFQTLLISGSQVAEVIGDGRVRGASLTGSEPAGISLATAAAQGIKPLVLELGGSDPFIILPSADLEVAIPTAVAARLIANGQSCIAAKRFIIHEQIWEPVLAGLLERFQAVKLGDPRDPGTDLGPLATEAIRLELHGQVQRAVAAGAQVLLGGELPPGPGYFYPPTLLVGLDPQEAVAQEEFFGPVALLFQVQDLEEAIQVANATPFGLGASAWTRDPQEQARLIRDLQAGSVFINAMTQSDPRVPFGGIKRSGYGRELGSFGLYELVNIQAVSIY